MKLIRKGIRGQHAEIVDQYRDSLPNFIIIGADESWDNLFVKAED